jgi:hypothetical protein
MTGEELAALTVALQVARPPSGDGADATIAAASRWKIAARRPDLELEELRAL